MVAKHVQEMMTEAPQDSPTGQLIPTSPTRLTDWSVDLLQNWAVQVDYLTKTSKQWDT
jgi:hypothetical protein